MLFRLVTLLDAADVAGNQRALGNGDAGSAEGAIQPRRNWITHGGLVESDPCFQLQVQVNAGGELRLFGFLLRNGLSGVGGVLSAGAQRSYVAALVALQIGHGQRVRLRSRRRCAGRQLLAGGGFGGQGERNRAPANATGVFGVAAASI